MELANEWAGGPPKAAALRALLPFGVSVLFTEITVTETD